MSRSVGMDVSKLCRASDEEEDCDERNEQNAGRGILRRPGRTNVDFSVFIETAPDSFRYHLLNEA